MDFSVIDEMFDLYKNEDLDVAKPIFVNYLKNQERYGKDYLKKLIKTYIETQSGKISNYFKSNKDDSLKEYTLIRDFVSAFENLILSVDFLVSDLVDTKESSDYYSSFFVKPHYLFSMDLGLLERAVNNYGDCYIDDFNKIKNLISYVKSHKILKKIYKDDSWQDINFEELMYSLYDYIDDKSVFNTEFNPSLSSETFLFESIKANCAKMLGGSFDKFRPNLNSSKQIRADFGKLIFCRNLLSFFETGIMPAYDGFVDFSLDYFEHLNLIDDFKRLYSKNFDEDTFKTQQGNFICNPEVPFDNYRLVASKRVKRGDKLYSGFIISCSDDTGSICNDYLIHISLDDINNQLSNYEIQISIIPHGDLTYRLQLLRLDNWSSKQSHRNIAQKLSTTTHVHIYNEFDLLRGKTNGGFDIAYNLGDSGVRFETALEKFLEILDLGDEISGKIYQKVTEVLTSRPKQDDELEI